MPSCTHECLLSIEACCVLCPCHFLELQVVNIGGSGAAPTTLRRHLIQDCITVLLAYVTFSSCKLSTLEGQERPPYTLRGQIRHCIICSTSLPIESSHSSPPCVLSVFLLLYYSCTLLYGTQSFTVFTNHVWYVVMVTCLRNRDELSEYMEEIQELIKDFTIRLLDHGDLLAL